MQGLASSFLGCGNCFVVWIQVRINKSLPKPNTLNWFPVYRRVTVTDHASVVSVVAPQSEDFYVFDEQDKTTFIYSQCSLTVISSLWYS